MNGGEKIRHKGWDKNNWIIKYDNQYSVDQLGEKSLSKFWGFYIEPKKWEIYAEPTEQSSSQAKLYNSFNKERFEAMFRVCAIIGNKEGKVPTWDSIFSATEKALKKLDAYYVEKGGANE